MWAIFKPFIILMVVILVLRLLFEALLPVLFFQLKRKIFPKSGFKRHANVTSSSSPDRFCPKCGGQMMFRSGKFGDFYGCSNFPRCKHTQPV